MEVGVLETMAADGASPMEMGVWGTMAADGASPMEVGVLDLRRGLRRGDRRTILEIVHVSARSKKFEKELF